MSLAGFQGPQHPDVTCVKFVYSDFRSLTSAVGQGEYVYRLNSCFDPDQTGVGGQPDGFDQYKLLYTRYRVVATDIDLQVVGTGTSVGLATAACSVSSALIGSAEEAAGLRHAKAAVFGTSSGISRIRYRVHMSQLSGTSDTAVLADTELAALVGSSPVESHFLHVCTETSGATDVVYFWLRMTMYTRMENGDYTIDVAGKHAARFARLAAGAPPEQFFAPSPPSLSSAVVLGQKQTTVRR